MRDFDRYETSDYLFPTRTFTDWLASLFRPSRARDRAEERARWSRFLSCALPGRIEWDAHPKVRESYE